jgi:hypothetical protein
MTWNAILLLVGMTIAPGVAVTSSMECAAWIGEHPRHRRTGNHQAVQPRASQAAVKGALNCRAKHKDARGSGGSRFCRSR